MRLRRLNQQGIQRLADELERIRTGESKALSRDLEAGDQFSNEVTPAAELSRPVFANRLAVAEYLHRLLGKWSLNQLEEDVGLWAWLSVFLFDQLCHTGSDGRRHPGETARWVPDPSNFKKYYRHLLAGPYRIYRIHADNPPRAMVLLCGAPDKPGELNEQLASRQELVTNPAVIETATELYVDKASGQPKRGAGGNGPGSVRRFATILRQYDVTWDLNLMEHEELLAMLPDEFDKFRQQTSSRS